MKKVSKLLHLVLGFTTGLLAGAFIRLGFEIVNGRPVSIGGEALLLPLVILLICFGFSLGKEVRVQRNFSKAYERGYRKGYGEGLEDGTSTATLMFTAFRRNFKSGFNERLGLRPRP